MLETSPRILKSGNQHRNRYAISRTMVSVHIANRMGEIVYFERYKIMFAKKMSTVAQLVEQPGKLNVGGSYGKPVN